MAQWGHPGNQVRTHVWSILVNIQRNQEIKQAHKAIYRGKNNNTEFGLKQSLLIVVEKWLSSYPRFFSKTETPLH